MLKDITVFMPYSGNSYTRDNVLEFRNTGLVDKIYLLSQNDTKSVEGAEILRIEGLFSSKTLKNIAEISRSPYLVLLTNDVPVKLGQFSLDRFTGAADSTGSSMLYSDYFDMKNDIRTAHPVIDYQIGSIRDDFNFGPLLFITKEHLLESIKEDGDYKFAGLYNVRLGLSRTGGIIRIPEFLYSAVEIDVRKSGEKLFDYVNPRNREVQIEMEIAATEHLKKIGAYLKPSFLK